VVGGDGPLLRLVPGWPQHWFAWRQLMPALARRFTVVAVDPRGVNLFDRATGGYDTGSLAADLVALMVHSRWRPPVGVRCGLIRMTHDPVVLFALAQVQAAQEDARIRLRSAEQRYTRRRNPRPAHQRGKRATHRP
jgi:hypothetical protein